jgi:hypothetical protein
MLVSDHLGRWIGGDGYTVSGADRIREEKNEI